MKAWGVVLFALVVVVAGIVVLQDRTVRTVVYGPLPQAQVAKPSRIVMISDFVGFVAASDAQDPSLTVWDGVWRRPTN